MPKYPSRTYTLDAREAAVVVRALQALLDEEERTAARRHNQPQAYVQVEQMRDGYMILDLLDEFAGAPFEAPGIEE